VSGDYRIQGRRATEIAADVERAVGAGELAPGAVLPPLREVAAELGVNPNTVAAAYRLLRDRGVIETAGRRGSRVRPRSSLTPRDELRLSVPEGVRDVADGNPDTALLPDWESAVRRALGAHAADPVLYGGPAMDRGLLGLATASFRTDGVPEAPIGVVSGSLDAIERIFLAHLRPGDTVAVEDPGWSSLLDLLPAIGLRAAAVPVDDEGPLPGAAARALAEGARALVVTSRAQNPTGASVSAQRAAELRVILAEYPEVLLIEDDHGHGIVDLPYHSLCGGSRSWAVVRSVAKSLGPDLRVAVLTGDPETLDRVRGRQRLGAGWVSHLLQRTTAALWARHEPAAVAAAYRARRDALVGALAGYDIPAYGRSGLNVWIPVRDETGAVAGMLQRGWAVAAGARFRLESPPGVRVTVSRLTEREIPLLAADIAAVLVRPRAGATRSV
jgi:DNA-binding transcriptional MocR family regulator